STTLSLSPTPSLNSAPTWKQKAAPSINRGHRWCSKDCDDSMRILLLVSRFLLTTFRRLMSSRGRTLKRKRALTLRNHLRLHFCHSERKLLVVANRFSSERLLLPSSGV